MAATLLHADVLTEKRRRMDQLQTRQARLGYDTPPEVTNEIQDIQRELAAAAPATIAESHDILAALMEETRKDVRLILWIGMPLLTVALTIAVVTLILVLVL